MCLVSSLIWKIGATLERDGDGGNNRNPQTALAKSQWEKGVVCCGVLEQGRMGGRETRIAVHMCIGLQK